MIRFIFGLMVVLGAVGGLDNADGSIPTLLSLALVGLFIMNSGVTAINRKTYD